ncbi:MAG: helix-turn-helix transcriptional regulator, partial [Alphaproteobacteria bacterium]|nr:helix-turn-helix transcriptional regulator [Alphaproteobacteria bacterium]
FRIMQERMAAEMTQEKMAEELGVSRTQYRKYECGSTRVNVQTLRRIAEILNTTVIELLLPRPPANSNLDLLADGQLENVLNGISNPRHRAIILTVAKLVTSNK